MTEIEQVQANALKYWWVKRKEKAKKLGWKFEGNCYKHDDGILIVIMLVNFMKIFIQEKGKRRRSKLFLIMAVL